MSHAYRPPWMRENAKVIHRFLQKKPDHIASRVKYSAGKKILTVVHFVVLKGDLRYERYLRAYYLQPACDLMLAKELEA